MSVPIGSHHMPTNILPRGAREHSWGECLLKSTARGPWRCVRVKVHQRARRLKFLCLNTPCVAQIRRRKNQPLRLNLKLGENLHSTCRAPAVLGGVEKVQCEGRILNLVQYSGDLSSYLLCERGMDGNKMTIVTTKLTKLATVTYRLKHSQLVRIL